MILRFYEDIGMAKVLLNVPNDTARINYGTVPLTYAHSPVGLCRRLCGHQWAASVMLRKKRTGSHVQTQPKGSYSKVGRSQAGNDL